MEKWAHSYVTLEEITEYVAAYMELLVLASGVQSSGHPFTWTPHHLRKAFSWADRLEKIMEDLSSTEEGIEGLVSRRALDAVLANLTASAKNYPAGLPHLTASDLSNARKILLQALLQAVVPDSDYLQLVTDSLLRLNEDEGESAIPIKEEVSARNSALRSAESLRTFVESAAGCLIFEKKQINCATSIWQTPVDRDNSNSVIEVADENLFKSWERNAMEYVTSFSTVYKTAAANLIFKSREEDWRRVLDTSRAYISSTMVGSDIANETEIAELCCLQLAFSESRDLAFRITASLPNAKLEITKTQGSTVPEYQLQEAVIIENFLAEILEKQVDLFWKLPPVLLAGVCASRFSLLKTYLWTITNKIQVLGRSCKCPCHESSRTCPPCQNCSNVLMEKLWCFDVHHSQLRTFQAQQVNSVCNFLLNKAQKCQSLQKSYMHVDIATR
ncbi:hypothetical protein M758_6G048600 [Ceratodon purpureus]|nr:hypothetical protein M758_6G048600 [Ceratodon purpureus]